MAKTQNDPKGCGAPHVFGLTGIHEAGGIRMWMTVGERRFAITLTDNAAARAFAVQLR